MAIYHPPTFINAYLKYKLGKDFDVPFFPTSPTALNDLTQTFPNSSTFCVYDRMLRMRKNPFPHIKSEQLMYYFYSTGEGAVEKVIETTQQVQDLLDYEDESAQDLNEWIKNNPQFGPDNVEMPKPFFHRLRVYQLQETRDVIDFGTARTYAGNKIIIDYDWHKS